ncbi:MAG TPA: alpha-ketoacid dehydrogenase subunit beta [Pseudoduganella sp.]
MKLSYREAVRRAMCDAMDENQDVFLMGEDVGRYGGTYAVSKGMLERYGPLRVRDTPLSELAFVGAGIGAAMAGMRPIVEVMTINFSLLALDQIVNTAATVRHMSGGQFNAPVVIRMASGAGRQVACQHSHSLEVWYAHVPGLRALAPATVADAYGMLRSALRCPDPVILFEHAQLYNLEDEVELAAASLHTAAILLAGRDLTIIAYGGCVPKALQAAQELAPLGILAEVLDLRVLRPLDAAAIADSVRHTHRALVVDEGWRACSLAAEVSARIQEDVFYELDAPVARLCSAEVPMPYAHALEQAALPQVASIVSAARQLVRK